MPTSVKHPPSSNAGRGLRPHCKTPAGRCGYPLPLGFIRLLGSGVVTQQPVPFVLLYDYLDTLAQHGTKEALPGVNHATFWRIATGVIGIQGNDITDSHIAATAMELNATLATCDKGFARFTGLKALRYTQLPAA